MLMRHCANTRFGRKYGLEATTTYEEFRKSVPVVTYEQYAEWVEWVRSGEQNVVWDKPVKWFAKSSGTTDSKSKYIPVTSQGLSGQHMRGPVDIMALYCHLYPRSRVLEGKMLTLGGSKRLERENDTIYSGDLSSILIDNTPRWAQWLRMPSKRTALLADFDRKVELICKESVGQNITSFSGVPSWNLVMLNRVLEYTGCNDILEVWPGMELFVHGGMNFEPYRKQYAKIIPSIDMKYFETYNASEGFFAIAQQPFTDQMLLMLDYGTFYEFLPTDRLDSPQYAVPLEGVQTGINYAMIISSTNGLWRYLIGDTVEFVSTDPYTIHITGRTKMFVNAFGEEVIIDNAERAMAAACHICDAEVTEYTMAPIYMGDDASGAHEWVIEFRKQPDSLEHFTVELDRALQNVNSDYQAKRLKNTTLRMPVVHSVAKDTFMNQLRSEGRMGGQVKVPRLSNDRRYVEQLLDKSADWKPRNPA